MIYDIIVTCFAIYIIHNKLYRNLYKLITKLFTKVVQFWNKQVWHDPSACVEL